MNENKNSVENKVNQALDNSIEELSPDIRRRLNQIRIDAVENKHHPFSYMKMASAFSFVFVAFLGWQFIPTQEHIPDSLFADVLQEDIEMLDELEFVYWMAEIESLEDETSATL